MLWRNRCQTAAMLLGIGILIFFIAIIGFQTIDLGISHVMQVQSGYSNGKNVILPVDIVNSQTNKQNIQALSDEAAVATMAPVRAEDIVKGKTNQQSTHQHQAQPIQSTPQQASTKQTKQNKQTTMTSGLFVERAGVGIGIFLKKGARSAFDSLLHVIENTKVGSGGN